MKSLFSVTEKLLAAVSGSEESRRETEEEIGRLSIAVMRGQRAWKNSFEEGSRRASKLLGNSEPDQDLMKLYVGRIQRSIHNSRFTSFSSRAGSHISASCAYSNKK